MRLDCLPGTFTVQPRILVKALNRRGRESEDEGDGDTALPPPPTAFVVCGHLDDVRQQHREGAACYLAASALAELVKLRPPAMEAWLRPVRALVDHAEDRSNFGPEAATPVADNKHVFKLPTFSDRYLGWNDEDDPNLSCIIAAAGFFAKTMNAARLARSLLREFRDDAAIRRHAEALVPLVDLCWCVQQLATGIDMSAHPRPQDVEPPSLRGSRGGGGRGGRGSEGVSAGAAGAAGAGSACDDSKSRSPPPSFLALWEGIADAVRELADWWHRQLRQGGGGPAGVAGDVCYVPCMSALVLSLTEGVASGPKEEERPAEGGRAGRRAGADGDGDDDDDAASARKRGRARGKGAPRQRGHAETRGPLVDGGLVLALASELLAETSRLLAAGGAMATAFVSRVPALNSDDLVSQWRACWDLNMVVFCDAEHREQQQQQQEETRSTNRWRRDHDVRRQPRSRVPPALLSTANTCQFFGQGRVAPPSVPQQKGGVMEAVVMPVLNGATSKSLGREVQRWRKSLAGEAQEREQQQQEEEEDTGLKMRLRSVRERYALDYCYMLFAMFNHATARYRIGAWMAGASAFPAARWDVLCSTITLAGVRSTTRGGTAGGSSSRRPVALPSTCGSAEGVCDGAAGGASQSCFAEPGVCAERGLRPEGTPSEAKVSRRAASQNQVSARFHHEPLRVDLQLDNARLVQPLPHAARDSDDVRCAQVSVPGGVASMAAHTVELSRLLSERGRLWVHKTVLVNPATWGPFGKAV
jgi:hypothetical protein